jgi:hypothetical protein
MSLSIPLASPLIRGDERALEVPPLLTGARSALDFDTNERYKGF